MVCNDKYVWTWVNYVAKLELKNNVDDKWEKHDKAERKRKSKKDCVNANIEW